MFRSAVTVARRGDRIELVMEHMFTDSDVGGQPGFRVEARADDDVLCLRAAGELDLAAAPLLEQALMRAESSAASGIWLDLSAVTFMDCAGFHVLLRAATRHGADAYRLRIDGVRGQVSRLIAITDVENRLPLGRVGEHGETLVPGK